MSFTGICVCTALLKAHSNISITLRSGLVQNLVLRLERRVLSFYHGFKYV